MTPVYKIINDYQELERYVDSLPDLGERYKYYISLFARKKYGGTVGLTSDKCQLKRCVASKDRIISKLKQMEVPVGAYTFRGKKGEEEIIVNQQSLVVYISANPRDMHKAAGATAKKIISDIIDEKMVTNPQAEALSHIQVTGKKLVFNVDLDFAYEDTELDEWTIKTWLRGKVNEDAYTLVRTRGGYHILVNLERIDKSYKKSWYNKIQQTEELPITIDMSNGDGMLPIPGCVQSNFTPFKL